MEEAPGMLLSTVHAKPVGGRSPTPFGGSSDYPLVRPCRVPVAVDAEELEQLLKKLVEMCGKSDIGVVEIFHDITGKPKPWCGYTFLDYVLPRIKLKYLAQLCIYLVTDDDTVKPVASPELFGRYIIIGLDLYDYDSMLAFFVKVTLSTPLDKCLYVAYHPLFLGWGMYITARERLYPSSNKHIFRF